MASNTAILETPKAIYTYALAGNARITVKNVKSGNHFTYAISKAKPNPQYPNSVTWFVGLLSGPDNASDYRYLGIVKGNRFFQATAKSPAESAPSFRVFALLWNEYLSRGLTPNGVEVRHSGKCGRCNRDLTVPESIDTGIGPVCAVKMGL